MGAVDDEVMDWDAAYRGEGAMHGAPPWNIGEPQPELAALWRAGAFRSEVLDAGCGHAELSLALAADGYTCVGIDRSPTAVAAATAAAAARGLSGRATFVADDITAFSGFDGRFSSVIDSTLFHSLPVAGRDGYLAAVHRAAAPGATLTVLVFAEGAFGAGSPDAPNAVTEAELREAVARHWTVTDIRPAAIHATVDGMPPAAVASLPADAFDDKGRMKLAAFLLRARRD